MLCIFKTPVIDRLRVNMKVEEKGSVRLCHCLFYTGTTHYLEDLWVSKDLENVRWREREREGKRESESRKVS